MLHAIHEDKCNVIGYLAWSLLDCFEWFAGYKYVYFFRKEECQKPDSGAHYFVTIGLDFRRCRMGIVHVDFEDPARKRTPKKSVDFFRKLLATRTLPPTES